MKVTRQSIFEQAARKMRADFEELRNVPHNALKGSQSEDIIRKFLSEHIPRRFSVGSGFIIDPRDTVSPQTDVIVFDALNCPVYRASEDAAIFPSDNVAAVVEVKSRLTKDELLDAAENAKKIKALVKHTQPEGIFRSQTMCFLFAFESAITLDKASEHFANIFQSIPIGSHIDHIVILDDGLISLSGKIRREPSWNPILVFEGFGGKDAEGAHLAIGANAIGQATLDYFMRLMIAGLMLFRPRVSHPGMHWQKTPSKGNVALRYLTSTTNERDPKARDQKLKEYAMEVRREFVKPPNETA